MALADVMLMVAELPEVVKPEPVAFHMFTPEATAVIVPDVPNAKVRDVVPVVKNAPVVNVLPFKFNVPEVNVVILVAPVVKLSINVTVPVL